MYFLEVVVITNIVPLRGEFFIE